MSNYVIEIERKTPIIYDTDVVVVGGGPAGVAAAIAAARNGVKTVLIERYGYLGGMITAGLCPIFMGVDRSAIRGIFMAVLDRLLEADVAVEGFFTPFDPEVFKFIVQEMVEEAGIKLLLHSRGVDVVMEGSKLKGIIVENKSGRQAVLGGVTIDATGDGDIAAKAKAPFNTGGTPENTITLLFRMGGVDIETLKKLRDENPNEFGPKPHPPSPPNPMMFRIPKKMVEEARNKGELRLTHENIGIIFLPRRDMLLVNAGHIVGADGTNVEDLTRGEIESRKQAVSIGNFLRKNVPGFESSFILDAAVGIGVRESRRIIGDYVLTKEDIVKGKRFGDAIAQNIMPIDIHGPGEAHTWIELKKTYDIPYRCLLPKDLNHLLVAGRCISTDHETQASIRSIPCCFATGEAAGTAAALSVKNNVSPKELDVEILQKTLVKQGVNLAKLN